MPISGEHLRSSLPLSIKTRHHSFFDIADDGLIVDAEDLRTLCSPCTSAIVGNHVEGRCTNYIGWPVAQRVSLQQRVSIERF